MTTLREFNDIETRWLNAHAGPREERETMPMDFPDFESLKRCAEVWKFRQPSENETEDEYREALANAVEPSDFVESCEIRNKVGWDRFSYGQKLDMLARSGRRNRR